ncbi:sigma-E factor negative regulatory protein [Bibersteinia trehalosi]|uniref:sigma-E factor negative regulatory protein n=1 Tax=Bibersteinia trehalosi TaxID=47735 RepID=UPI0040468511
MQQRETLSAYMDGHDVNGEFTDTLCASSELQQKWADYHAIRSIMRGEEQLLGADFSAKMAALIEKEEIETAVAGDLNATTEKPRGLLLQLKRWSTPLMQAGIAASVCFAAVVGVNLMNAESEVAQVEQPVLQTLPFSNSVQPVSYNSPASEQPTVEQIEAQQRRVNALLQNHELQRRTHLNNDNSKEQTAEVDKVKSQQ